MSEQSDELTLRPRRDECILAHVGLYQLTLARVVRRLFFPKARYPDRATAKKLCGDTLAALVRANKLKSHKFPNGEDYFSLASQKPVNTQAVDYDLGTLWLCCMERKRFHRLSTPEVRRLFSTPPHHHVRHCLADEEGGPVVYRLYFSSVDVKSAVTQARKHLTEARNKHGLTKWIECGDYGFIVCCESEGKAQEISEALRRPTASGALHEQARFIVATVPTSSTVGTFERD